MGKLFKVETDRLVIGLSQVRGTGVRLGARAGGPPGLLRLVPRRPGLRLIAIDRGGGASSGVDGQLEETAGPRLFEETDYRLDVEAKGEEQVRVLHLDPVIGSALEQSRDGRAVVGLVNFGSQAGYSLFEIQVNGRPELDLQVEVFPGKLDYRDDYERMLADVQEVLVGLALEYLRGTFVAAAQTRQPRPSELEWLAVLRHVLTDLELALRQVDRHPVRGMQRELLPRRVDRLSRVDSKVRASLRRGGGGRSCVDLGGLVVRERCTEHRAKPTLDTPEHRWLARQVVRIRRRLAELRRTEMQRDSSLRRDATVRQLADIEAKMDQLSRLAPLAESAGEPPTSFTSQVLLSAPGYREAYRACLVLSLGLRIEGEPLKVSLKDLDVLYEYWCFLAVVRMLCEETGQPLARASSLFTVGQNGLRVQLQRGRKSVVALSLDGGRELRVKYNPQFTDEDYLIPQAPDVVISLSEPSWPEQHLVLDAKYRVDNSDRYVGRYGFPGAPEDALNAMHRYRDAITERQGGPGGARRGHTVVQAAALFPGRVEDESTFRMSRLWRSLESIGVGALPFLPYEDRFVREWVRSFLRRGGWSLAARAIPHRSAERVWRAQEAAAETVLVGNLRSEWAEHLEWVREKRIYYMPLLGSQRLQHAVSGVVLYKPSGGSCRGRVDEFAPVTEIEIRRREDLGTPWPWSRDGEELQVVFHLGQLVMLRRPIVNESGQRVSSHRWTSRLAVDRATTLEELMVETEAEWRLYEDLRAMGKRFSLRAGTASVPGVERTRPRVWFVVDGGPEISFRGPSGFQVRGPDLHDLYVARVDDVLSLLVTA